jgi:A/G-specific adenine glycosylase
MASDPTGFRKLIFLWWKTHRRELPWRRTHNPYHILISEVMLQQTQVARVVPKYREFLRAFPTVQDLANATPAQVLRVWQGMGYNRRALYLYKTARSIVSDYQGIFPQSEDKLVQLPGLGTYTARALLVFAYRQHVAMVDTNIRRIITHFFFDDVPQPEAKIQAVADRLVPKGKSWEWHQALMDYGALALRIPRTPSRMPREAIPFKESNRFYRGRIVDRLRQGNIQERILLQELKRVYDKPHAFLRPVLETLLRDGLVERSPKGELRLPHSW